MDKDAIKAEKKSKINHQSRNVDQKTHLEHSIPQNMCLYEPRYSVEKIYRLSRLEREKSSTYARRID